MRTVDFYFDYLSPYAYLAAREIEAVCARQDAELRWRPVLFAGLLNHWGQRGPAEIPPKGRHAFRECLRYAVLHDIPFRSPRLHPFRPLTALRVSLASVAGDAQARVISTVFDLGWGRGGDLGDDSEISAALREAGLDGRALLERADGEEAKQELRTETEAAVARGVFGIPTMLAGDELFWGLDQLRYLELHLEGRDPLADVDVDVTSVLSHGRGAWRTGVTRQED